MLDTKGCRGQLMNIAQRLLSIDSPSGFTDQVVREAEQIARDHGYAVRRTNKGNLVVSVPGRERKRVGLCAHIDTLGLMVRSITADGMLMTTRIGGPILPTLDGEYCRIHTRDGRIYTGTILSLSPAAHVFDDVLTRPRDEKNLAVRIDEVVEDRAGVEALGIAPGDFVCIDPKTVVTDSGFLKSRFIDDKGSAACLLTLLRLMHIAGQRPRYDTEVSFTVHEEVGHGGATLPQVDELLAVDMGCVGDDLSCTERQVSICAGATTAAPTTMAWSPAWWSWPGPTPSPTRWTSTPTTPLTSPWPGTRAWTPGAPSSAPASTPPTAWSGRTLRG